MPWGVSANGGGKVSGADEWWRQGKKKLKERLSMPRVPADALFGLPDHYKIKLRSAGYRLVYRVEESRIVVTVVAVGKRERSDVYVSTKKRS